MRPIVWLGVVALLAVALRATDLPGVFPPDGTTELAPADSAYHARRALYSFHNFPSVLTFDPYMAWPDGAPVPMPPLYDWAVGGLARCFGDTEQRFERVAAWLAPAFAALTVVPVYAIARSLAGPGVGLGAALLFAILPAGARRATLGDLDHHAAVALLGASWLALSLAHLAPNRGRASLARCAVGLAGVRAALVLTWSGSILYLVVGETALLLGAILDGRRSPLLAQAAGTLGAALLVTPVLRALPPPVPLATTDWSWLHVLFLLGTALVALVVAGSRRASAGARLAVAAVAACSLAGLALLWAPELAQGLDRGLAFLGREDTWGARNAEQRSLFAAPLRQGSVSLAILNYGWLAWLVPLAPLAALERARDTRLRARAVCFGIWSLAFTALAVAQVRFGSDFAPVAAVSFAFLLGRVGQAGVERIPGAWVARHRSAVAVGVGLGVGTLLLWPALVHNYGSAATPRIAGPGEGQGGTLLSQARSLTRFARMIRAATPETVGYRDADARPEYAVLVRPGHGHTLHYMARRATPANNFGPYLDRQKYVAARRFFQVPTRREALDVARRLGVRYFVTFARAPTEPEAFVDRLHRSDGLVGPEAPDGRLRLVVEGPFGGVPPLRGFPAGTLPQRAVPYKLFEIVEGAVLEARLAPGEEMDVRVQVDTNLGRRLPLRARVRADASGAARLRVPYPTAGEAPVRTAGPYRVRVGDGEERRVTVSEDEVREGRVVPVPPASG